MVGASCAAGTHRPLRAAGGTHALEHLLRLTTWACAARCCGLQAGQQPRQHGRLGQQGPQKACRLAVRTQERGKGLHIQITGHLSAKDRAYMMTAELFLMQHTCHWYCKSKTIASARMMARHQTPHEQLVNSVSEPTRKAYLALIQGH